MVAVVIASAPVPCPLEIPMAIEPRSREGVAPAKRTNNLPARSSRIIRRMVHFMRKERASLRNASANEYTMRQIFFARPTP